VHACVCMYMCMCVCEFVSMRVCVSQFCFVLQVLKCVLAKVEGFSAWKGSLRERKGTSP